MLTIFRTYLECYGELQSQNKAMNRLLLVCFASCLTAAPLRIQESAFSAGPDGNPPGWTTWSSRAETAPRCFVDMLHYRSHPGSLAVNGNSNPAGHGGWHRTITGIQAGAWYRFTAWYRAEAVPYESLQVL